jgi:hypothetical protein
MTPKIKHINRNRVREGSKYRRMMRKAWDPDTETHDSNSKPKGWKEAPFLIVIEIEGYHGRR